LEMEIGLKLCNGNLKEWELTVWEWDGMRIKSLFPVISSVNAALRITYEARKYETSCTSAWPVAGASVSRAELLGGR